MATKVLMEALSPTMEEGRLVSWHKAEGDAVRSGEVLAEVETDKAVMELVARGDGVLRKRLIAEGATAPVGQLVGIIAAPDENIEAILATAATPAAASGAAAAPPAAAPVAAPAPQAVSGNAPPAPTTQTAAPSPAPSTAPSHTGERRIGAASPIPRTPGQSQGEASTPPQEQVPLVDRRAGMPLPGTGDLGVAAQSGASIVGARGGSAATGNGGRVRSSPLARRVASERGVDLGAIAGTGPNGRVIKRDVESVRVVPAPLPAAPRVVPEGGDFHDVPLTQIRKTIAKRLAESIGPVPTFYLTADLDVDRVAEMRSAMASQGEAFRVSFNDVLLKIVATALEQHPEVNAHWMGDRIRYYNRVHIGVAVAVEDGLITPVVFDANTKGLRQIADEVRALAERARARKLTPEEYTGATFSVSNLGMFGIEQFTAIINPPETAILAVGAVESRPVVSDGAVVIRRRMRVTMSCDHRVIDGATGARFLQTLRQLVENPLLMVF
jgi:pyruvate dehydrogenase E2 component (dihydrolipoamide acetyltransferase)